MNSLQKRPTFTALFLALLTCACGGGGGNDKVASTPPPPTSTPPVPGTATAPPVKIFATPTQGEYGALGARANVGEWSVTAPSTPSAGAVLKPDIDLSRQARIRYTAAGTYEVNLLGSFETLVQPSSTPPAPADNPAFKVGDRSGSRFTISLSRDKSTLR